MTAKGKVFGNVGKDSPDELNKMALKHHIPAVTARQEREEEGA